MKLLYLAYMGSCSRIMTPPPKKEDLEPKEISSKTLTALMNEGKVEKKWVFHHETGLPWLHAAEDCRRSGGVLAYFDDAYDHIEALKQIPMDARFWVGYSDLGLEGYWKTVTNQTPEYVRWIEQQPDDRLDNEDCALMIMGNWGRGRMMDANCMSPTGVNEWTTPVGHLCRFDSKPEDFEMPDELENQNKEKFELDKETLNDSGIEEEKVLLPFEMPVPKWAEAEEKRHFIDDKLIAKIKKSASLSTTLQKFTERVKVQEEKSTKIDDSFNLLTDNFAAIKNVTEAIRNDNRFIFNQISLLKGQSAPDMAKERANMQSNADRKENSFWISRQKSINMGFTKGFEKQKERLASVEDDVQSLWGNFTELDIAQFMEEQADQNEYLREAVVDLTYTNDRIKQTLEIMNMQFEKVFKTLSMILRGPPPGTSPQGGAPQGGPPQGGPPNPGNMGPSQGNPGPAPVSQNPNGHGQMRAPPIPSGPSQGGPLMGDQPVVDPPMIEQQNTATGQNPQSISLIDDSEKE